MDEPILSSADEKEIEQIYRRNTTPLRCRLGLHEFPEWTYMMSIQCGARKISTGRPSETLQFDLYLRVCERCAKAQAKIRRPAQVTDLDQIGQDDEDDDE